MEKEQSTNQSAAMLNSDEMDAIGEVMNISMGASATAISAMLDKQVIITTPSLTLMEIGNLDYSNLEPAVLVKIRFVQSILGTNVMLFRRHDMQIILNLLMGNEDIIEDEDFEFDDLSMSAACEVMNQMMGSAATALSEILQESVNISTPEACVVDSNHPFSSEFGVEEDPKTSVVSISFDLTIKGVMNTNFVSVIPIDLARSIVNKLLGDQEQEEEQTPPPAVPEPVKVSEAPIPAAPVQPPVTPPTQPAVTPPPVQVPPVQAPPVMQEPAAVPPQQYQAPAAVQQPVYPGVPAQPPMPQQAYQAMPNPYQGQMPPYQQPMQQGGYPMYPPQGYQQMPAQMNPGYGAPPSYTPDPSSNLIKAPTVGVKKAQFPDFSQQDVVAHTMNDTNMGLLMNVPLDVSVEIGKTKRKIKEIAEFGQGTILELEKQAGAPVDIIVNGQLLAHGDVVVIGDNFGVRITSIVGTKELMNVLGNVT